MNKVLCSMLVVSSFVFANSYEEAEKLESIGKYKEAMEIYKKIAKEDTLTSNLKKEDSFTKVKNEFYENTIDKVENKITNESIKQSITGDFDLHPYKKNYLMPLTLDTNTSDGRKTGETQFQFSIEKPLFYNVLGFNETISVAYTQKSMWQTLEESAPFRENNYEPELFVVVPYEKDSYLKSYKIALNHQSNGKGGLESKSWNRAYLETTFQVGSLFIIPKVWYRIPEDTKDDNNPDIHNYLGYGELNFIYTYERNQFDLTLRDNLRDMNENKGSAELTWTFPLPIVNFKNVYGMVNLYSGYGNSLIDYDRESNKIGFGIALTR